MKRFLGTTTPVLAVLILFAQPALSFTSGLDFAGGCPSGQPTALCDQGGNADADNVAALLGLDPSLVLLIGEINDSNPTNPNFAISGLGTTGTGPGTWTVDMFSDITHLAFKADTYFILGEVTEFGGFWMMDTSGPDTWVISEPGAPLCPTAICGVERAYETDDFLNNGGQVAALSNVRAFTVIPLPASAWLFGSALGLLGWVRRRFA